MTRSPARTARTLSLALALGLVGLVFTARPGVVRAEEAQPAAPPAPPAPPLPPPVEPPLVEALEAPGVPLEARVVGPRPVIGPRPEVALRKVPGSGTSLEVVTALKAREPLSVQDAVRTLAGVVVRPEVGSGVVPNIGVRGLNPDRSERLLILEDGVPAGLAPYIENAAYYVPPFERMARLELLKGSGSILHGPHTVGGVLNLITPDIPNRDCGVHGRLRTIYGSDGYLMGYGEAGQTVPVGSGRLGYLVQGLAKRGDGWRDESDFDLLDLTAKVRWTLCDGTNLTFKVNAYDSTSKETYLGLTQGMFEADAYQNPVRHDELAVRWWSSQLTFQRRFSACWELVANAYWSTATRDWNRQDFRRNTGFAAAPANTVATVGNPALDGGAIFLRASYGSRDRDFDKWGVEPRLIGKHTLLGRPATTEVGVRFHHEEMVDERNNRASLHADPVLDARDVRGVDAWAFFAQEQVELTSRLTLSVGLRVEAYELERHQQVLGGLPVDARGTTDNLEWIPGAGLTYALTPCHTLFGGVHRGFSPPRTAQAIASDGADLELDAERSWNYELGLRGRFGSGLSYEVTGFAYDFQNQVVPDNESGGTSTDVVNAGQTRHLGAETALTFDLAWLVSGRCDPCRTGWFLDLAYTYVDAENTTPGGTFQGKELPYAPHHVGTAGLRFESPGGLSVALLAHWMGEQFADQANTLAPSADGTRGLIDEHVTVDLRLRYRVPRSALTLTAALNNLFDETYVASRAPEGVFPGLPLHGFLGLEVEF